MWRRTLVGLVFVATLTTACGDGAGTTDSEAVPGAITLDVVGREFFFSPDTWRVDSGAGIQVRFDNEGSVAHEWIVLRQPITRESEYSASAVLMKLTAAPGTRSTGTFAAPDPGVYQVICAVAGHFGAGMVGELIVRG